MATKKKASPAKRGRTSRPASKAGKKPRAAAKRAPAKAAAAAAGAVTVRMFCQGLGDCFLLTVPQGRGRPYSILIDLGVAMGTPRAEGLMREVIDEIAALTGGSKTRRGTVDLLVVTHQHWDHVSGFLQAPDALEKLTFRHLWMAWTESETDGLAKQLRGEFAKAKLAMDRAIAKAAKLAAADPTNDSRRFALESVMAFFGPPAAAAAAAGAKGKAAGGKLGLPEAMTAARELVGSKDAVECLFPGHTTKLPGAAAGLAKRIETFVLGPPHDRAKLVRINPREKQGEAYEKHKGDAPGLAINSGWNASVMKELLGADGGGDGDGGGTGEVIDPELDRTQPFDRSRGRSWKEAEKDAYFRARYFDDAELNRHRRIDGDWLWSGAQRLALQMDSYTNNTSLVLAFELPESKDVLLFVGDAQIGNWLSWHDQKYTTTDGRELTAEQLLARTVLYKVGHHGSHNATLRDKGFELMTHPELMAMLPVEADGVKRLRYGQMPLKSLMDRLRDRTGGRILRVDQPWTDEPPGTWTRPGTRPRLATRKLTVGKDEEASQRPVYMELVIPDR